MPVLRFHNANKPMLTCATNKCSKLESKCHPKRERNEYECPAQYNAKSTLTSRSVV